MNEIDPHHVVNPAVARRMSHTRSRDTGFEMAVRRALFARGLRFRVAYKALPQRRYTIDVAFTKARVAVLLDGCFWHGCPDHYRPATGETRAFWANKVADNVARDTKVNAVLREAGWTVMRFWEHEAVEDIVSTVEQVLHSPAPVV